MMKMCIMGGGLVWVGPFYFDFHLFCVDVGGMCIHKRIKNEFFFFKVMCHSAGVCVCLRIITEW